MAQYNVYTDGAGSNINNSAGSSYCIITDYNFIGSGFAKKDGVDNPTHAETIAVGLALAYLDKYTELSDSDIVYVNTDCLAVISFCKQYIGNNDNVRSNIPEVRATITIVRGVSKKCRLRFRKVKGHKDFINPNTYVDRLAKLAIRR